MTKTEIGPTLLKSSAEVLETMFFSPSVVCEDSSKQHVEAVACMVFFNGAEEGVFTVAVDHAALALLCDAFYGNDGTGSIVKECELLCEFSNMLTGSTLSAYTPDQYCSLASPLLCDMDRHLQTMFSKDPSDLCTSIRLEIDGGLLTVSCKVKAEA